MTHTDDVYIWINSGPSRRLRKAYAVLECIERQMDAVRASNPFPEHAPTACCIISRQLRELSEQHYAALKRIGKLEGDD